MGFRYNQGPLDMAAWHGGKIGSRTLTIDRKSGFCDSTSTFYSKREPMAFPPNQFLDVTTFNSSQPHSGKTVFVDAVTGRRLSFSELWLGVERVYVRIS